nr:MAG TPA: TrfB transcriptional repressor protein/DNA Complex-turn-helix, complex, transcription.5A [Caudoviricetes sp.]
MTKRQNTQERDRIVEKFLYSLEDGKQRLVCLLIMRNATEKEICKAVKISPEELVDIKLQIAIGLRQAGIRI